MIRKIFVSLLLILLAGSINYASAASRLQNVRYSQNPGVLRIVLDLTGEFEYKEFYVENPSRVVIDIQNAVVDANAPKDIRLNSPEAKRIRVGQFNATTARVVIESIAEVKTFVLDGGPSGARLVIDLIDPKKNSTPQPAKPSTTLKPSTQTTSPSTNTTVKPSANDEKKKEEERERKLKEELERKEKAERERQIEAEVERRVKAELERKEKEEKERKAKEEKERKEKEEKAEKERKEKEEKERKAKERKERERKEREEQEKSKKHKIESHDTGKEVDAPFSEVDKDLDKLMTLKGKIIVLDPGHGGNDAGAIGPSGVMEKTVTLNVALELEKMLKAHGAEVIMTRRTDKTVSPKGASASAIEELQARCDVANRAKATIFISIHADSFTNSSARGTTGYYYSQTEGQASIKLADCIRKALCEQIRTPSRGTKPCNFYVVRNTDMPATLIELAFISNPEEERIMSSKDGVLKCAQGIFDGIEDYFG